MYENVFEVGSFYGFGFFKTTGYQFINHTIGRVQFNDLPFVYDGNAVAKLLGLIHIMGGDDDGGTTAAYFPYQVPEVAPGLRIETRGGLI